METPDHFPCLLRNLYAGQEITDPNMKQQTGSKLGREYVKTVRSPCLLTFCAEYIMQNARLDESQAGIKIAGRNTNLRYAGDPTLMAESKEELKNLLMRVKGESEKAGLKLSIQRTKIMASSLITLWQTDGGKNGNSDRLYFFEF